MAGDCFCLGDGSRLRGTKRGCPGAIAAGGCTAPWITHRHSGTACSTFGGGICVHASARVQYGGTGRRAQVGGSASGGAVFRFFSSGPDCGFRDPERHEGSRAHAGLAPAESRMADGWKIHFR